jgi:hypothetical protein
VRADLLELLRIPKIVYELLDLTLGVLLPGDIAESRLRDDGLVRGSLEEALQVAAGTYAT